MEKKVEKIYIHIAPYGIVDLMNALMINGIGDICCTKIDGELAVCLTKKQCDNVTYCNHDRPSQAEGEQK